ncbi:unnamed protein product [Calypogeia fissa]
MSGGAMDNALNIAAKTPKIEVDNRLSLRFYYRTAANLLRQASIYRDEHNIIDLYILLVRFSSLVTETIPYHRDYRTTSLRERAEYKKKLLEVLNELEGLKPEVNRQVERINQTRNVEPIDQTRRLPPPSASADEWDDFMSQWPAARIKAVTNGQERNKELPRIGTADYHEPHSGFGDYWSSPSVLNTVDSRLSNLSMSIPRPRDETLSRHSFLGPNVPRRPSSSAPFKAQYPNYIDATPIQMPSLEQSLRGPPQPNGGSSRSNNLLLSSEPVLWPDAESTIFPGGYSPVIGPDVAPVPSLIRQPDPPPVAARVQTLERLNHSYTQVAPARVADPRHHSYTQVAPDRVADPRPGSPQPLEDEFGQQKGTKHLHISTRMMAEFLALSKLNTQRNLETCAVLAGSLKKGVFYVSALVVPKQEATSDSCQTVNEEEIFEVQDSRGLFQLGWIHTHPTQTCFMSSIDLHTHYSYQVMLQEAIAIVMAPTDSQREYGIFRLSDPGGVKSIQKCQQRGFHPHEAPDDGSPIYEHCSHVFMNPNLKFDVIDLRQS